MYKDKDKQREANKQASKKYRDSMTGKGMTVAPEVIPKSDVRVIPTTRTGFGTRIRPKRADKRLTESECLQSHVEIAPPIKPKREANRQAQAKFKAKGITKGITNQGITSAIQGQRQAREGYGSPTSADVHNKTIGKHKRGKDIKCFADLPPDVQATINRLSDTNEEKQKRTAAAINYQHLFPDRYYSTGAA